MSKKIYQNMPDAQGLVGLETKELAGYVLEHLHADRHNRLHSFHPGNLASEIASHYPPEHRERVSNLVREACQWLKNRDFIYDVNEQGFFDFTKRGEQTTTAEALLKLLTSEAATARSIAGFDHVRLDPEQEELFRKLVEAQQSLPKHEREDFTYSPAYTRAAGARKREELERAIDEGGSVRFKDQLVSKKEDIPWNLDHDLIVHPGLPGGRTETTQDDIDALTTYDLIRFRDQTKFFIHPDGLAYYRQSKAQAVKATDSTLVREGGTAAVKNANGPARPAAKDPYRIVGTVLANKYELIEFTGSGGMGVVYRARKLDDQSVIAVKVLKPDIVARSPEYAELFSREAENVRGLDHPNIVKVFDSGEDEGLSYMAMEWVEGKSLEEVISNAQLSIDRVTKIFGQVCDAVAAAHEKGIIHLDLKPANVLLVADAGSGDFVKVIDFGLSRVISRESGTTVTKFRGTHQYCAPEQFGGRVSHRSDIYSLGATLYHLITGVLPFGASYINAKFHPNLELPPIPSVTHQRDVSSEVDFVISKALNKAPNLRQQSALQLFEEFSAALRGRLLVPDGDVYYTMRFKGTDEVAQAFVDQLTDKNRRVRRHPEKEGFVEIDVVTSESNVENLFWAVAGSLHIDMTEFVVKIRIPGVSSRARNEREAQQIIAEVEKNLDLIGMLLQPVKRGSAPPARAGDLIDGTDLLLAELANYGPEHIRKYNLRRLRSDLAALDVEYQRVLRDAIHTSE